MCCFFTALVFFGPRLGFLIYWLIAPLRVNAAFQTFNLPGWWASWGWSSSPGRPFVRDDLPVERL